ncbi:alpha-isopropylmalate synthase regulatory domain-containing protein [Streptomyces chattanoogensis]|uniref:alpha-isopropylmalate synthase regulatory domain-containing protein n=1 Tax=Streptomyces chattanoogensis TaxID=66876 RepID=UPI0036CEDF66
MFRGARSRPAWGQRPRKKHSVCTYRATKPGTRCRRNGAPGRPAGTAAPATPARWPRVRSPESARPLPRRRGPLPPPAPRAGRHRAAGPHRGEHRVNCEVNGRSYEGTGNGPLAAFCAAPAAAGHPVDFVSYAEHATASGPDSAAVAYVRCRIGGAAYWGAGQDTSVLMASVRAVLSAVNRAAGGGASRTVAG